MFLFMDSSLHHQIQRMQTGGVYKFISLGKFCPDKQWLCTPFGVVLQWQLLLYSTENQLALEECDYVFTSMLCSAMASPAPVLTEAQLTSSSACLLRNVNASSQRLRASSNKSIPEDANAKTLRFHSTFKLNTTMTVFFLFKLWWKANANVLTLDLIN